MRPRATPRRRHAGAAHALAGLVQEMCDAAAFLAGPFDGMFTLDDNKVEKAVNWGLAAVVWYGLGRLIARLLLRRQWALPQRFT